MKIKCDCCGKMSIAGAQNRNDNSTTCLECLKYAPSYYGFTSGKELHRYIKQRKKWWEFWK